MIHLSFTVLDKVAQVYGAPFHSKSKALALRDFAHACRDNQSALYRSPEDFSLWLIGSYDDETGIITPLSKPEHVGDAVQFIGD